MIKEVKFKVMQDIKKLMLEQDSEAKPLIHLGSEVTAQMPSGD